jgi:hypothetical protein
MDEAIEYGLWNHTARDLYPCPAVGSQEEDPCSNVNFPLGKLRGESLAAGVATGCVTHCVVSAAREPRITLSVICQVMSGVLRTVWALTGEAAGMQRAMDLTGNLRTDYSSQTLKKAAGPAGRRLRGWSPWRVLGAAQLCPPHPHSC